MTKPNQIPWVDGLTIPQMLDRTIERFGQRDAVVFPRLALRWNYRQFAEQVDRAARGLLALGIQRGEHVAIWSTNVPEWVVLQFATARIGAVLVTINPSYRAFELEYVLKQSDAVALVLTDRFKSSDYFAMLAEVCPEIADAKLLSAPGRGAGASALQSPEFPKLRHVIAIKGATPAGAISWPQMLALGDQVPDRRRSRCIGSAATHRPHQHPIHLRHHRLSQGRNAQPSQFAAERLLHRRLPAASPNTIASASPCRFITASAACWAR